MTTTPAHRPSDAAWLTATERGTLLGIQALYWLATVGGRLPARALVRMVALWYVLTDRKAVEASRSWLRVVHEREPTFGEVYGHILRFAQVTLDRIFFLKGQVRGLVITKTGNHHLEELARTKRGAILLGAHLGSFEAMRAGADHDRLPIHILGHFANAKMINALFERLNPALSARVIHIEPETIDYIFRAQQKVEDGDMLAMLGDRIGLNEKTITATFFGREAQFPSGPWILAAALRCPVYLVFGLYREPNRYDLFCEPFVDRVELPRKHRDERLREIVQAYATRLESFCRRAPDNWFNFFDFWDPGHDRR